MNDLQTQALAEFYTEFGKSKEQIRILDILAAYETKSGFAFETLRALIKGDK